MTMLIFSTICAIVAIYWGARAVMEFCLGAYSAAVGYLLGTVVVGAVGCGVITIRPKR